MATCLDYHKIASLPMKLEVIKRIQVVHFSGVPNISCGGVPATTWNDKVEFRKVFDALMNTYGIKNKTRRLRTNSVCNY